MNKITLTFMMVSLCVGCADDFLLFLLCGE
uniref:Uncharacterized protein n=1 Tax=Myoviridae sp. ctLnO19 TaxID=2825085 RepID=A0A8S5P0P9_9CAUD|nr:MAG TPA: hypothetical protein [Myoviridae sp. ctLnO19]DAQ70064.1 MAG TPA: hypothetical protein [Caudoviricetes sp.]DAR85433.1 MAG TPA: hypothetical protein [Caudoviricetes sp.]DAS03598.1 MAG TPA: hypothetical protein [Caudoviricetes sp.]DAS06040.1 MAG TPA: hypothetical protein [Caudoviricetes sp.]